MCIASSHKWLHSCPQITLLVLWSFPFLPLSLSSPLLRSLSHLGFKCGGEDSHRQLSCMDVCVCVCGASKTGLALLWAAPGHR